MRRLGWAQAEKSKAISEVCRTGKMVDTNATTRADSISVNSPANGRMAVYGIKHSDGWSVEVSEEEILSAQLELTKDAGVFVEPAAACAFAAFKKDSENVKAKLGEDAVVTVLLTGTGFKDMAVFDNRVSLPKAIENSVEEVKKLNF